MKLYTQPVGAKISKQLKKDFDERCLKIKISKSGVLRYLFDSFAKGNIDINSEDLLGFEMEFVKSVNEEDKEPFIVKISKTSYEELEKKLVEIGINKTFAFTYLMTQFTTGKIRIKNDLWS